MHNYSTSEPSSSKLATRPLNDPIYFPFSGWLQAETTLLRPAARTRPLPLFPLSIFCLFCSEPEAPTPVGNNQAPTTANPSQTQHQRISKPQPALIFAATSHLLSPFFPPFCGTRSCFPLKLFK